MERLLKNESVQRALDFIREDDARTLAQQLELCEIPAPSFEEKKRAEYMEKEFKKAGLTEVGTDEAGNVLGWYRGSGDGPVIMLAAHMDTVFPMETKLKVREENGVYYCPGINDDTRALAEILTVARAFVQEKPALKGSIVFCANVCEEGLGDLKGVKYLFGNANHGIDAFVSIDNQETGGIIYTATGSHRYEVFFRGCGGHSFGDFGIPSPIHAMGRAIGKIAEFKVPAVPKTTFNVGVIKGGTSVNTIAEECSMLVDLRSDGHRELEGLDEQLHQAVKEAVEEENNRWNSSEKVTAEFVEKGNRPAGAQDEDAPIVRTAWKAAKLLGITPQLRYESSTDANIPISMGIPAITVGRGGKEGKMHTLQEWFKPEEAWLGPQKDLLILLALAGVENCMEPVIG